MTKSTIVAWGIGMMLGVVVLAACDGPLGEDASSALTPATADSMTGTHEGLIYGRVTTDDDSVYEGRLRWGGNEEALWGNYFNGFKDENPWVAYMPSAKPAVEFFGIAIAGGRQGNLGRPFMARFGDIARIESHGADIQVILKSGSVFVLDRFAADDLADGLRVWDARGVVDLSERRIRRVDLLPSVPSGGDSFPLYGQVRTANGDFTGLVQWDRQECLGSDELAGRTADGDVSLRFDTIRSIARGSGDDVVVTLLDGRDIRLAATGEAGGAGGRGVYVDDARYGRVLISWDVFERVDFSPGGTGPAYHDFPPGGQLIGSVTTQSGRRVTGRLVYDLDETETTETLDAPSHGVNYTILFGLIASIVPGGAGEDGAGRATVTLHTGEVLHLERSGDLGEANAGLLVFVDGGERPEYVSWSDVRRIDFDRPKETYPSGEHRRW